MQRTYEVTIEAEWLNDKKGGWNVTATMTREGVKGVGRAVAYSNEATAVQRATGAALAALNRELRGKKA